MMTTLQPLRRSSIVTFKESINMAKHHTPDDELGGGRGGGYAGGEREEWREGSTARQPASQKGVKASNTGPTALFLLFSPSFRFGESEWQVRVGG